MKALVILLALAGTAYAYPQYQLSHDQTCTGCHLSPDGGGILNENGTAVAESTAWRSGSGEWMYGRANAPSWLALGGDARAAAGFIEPGVPSVAAYPMQVEVSASASTHGFTLHAVGGLRSPKEDGTPLHVIWSREHYAMWQSNPGGNDGIYIRAGRFMPTFGLRLAEHVVYTQKFGGRPLYAEAYGASASYVSSKFEAHATGFVHDPLVDSAEHGDGGAFYTEVRLGEHAAVGADAKYTTGDEVDRTYAGITAKVYAADWLFLGEAEVIRQHITAGAGDKYTQLAGYLMGSHPIAEGFLLDIGAGHFTQDTRVKGLFRDCIDANLHWFVTPHFEALATTRLELLDLGSQPTGGYVLIQGHYRL